MVGRTFGPPLRCPSFQGLYDRIGYLILSLLLLTGSLVHDFHSYLLWAIHNSYVGRPTGWPIGRPRLYSCRSLLSTHLFYLGYHLGWSADRLVGRTIGRLSLWPMVLSDWDRL